MSWVLVLLSGLLVLWLQWRQHNRRLLKIASSFPGPPALPFLGNALSFIVKPEEVPEVIRTLIATYGSAFRFWLGPDLNIVVSDPDDLKALLTNPKTSVKGPVYKYMADVLGGGILSGSGQKWRRHRKIATPNYGKRAIEGYNSCMNQEIDFLLQKLRKMEMRLNGRTTNIYKEVVKTTTYAFCQTLMGLTREQTLGLPYIQELIDVSPNLYKIVFDRMTRWYLQIDPVFWLTERHKKLKYGVKLMDEFCSAIIRLREEFLRDSKTLSKRKDLIETEDDPDDSTALSVIDRFILSGELTPEELIQETFTVFTSSQEATAKIASAIFLMLAYHPECQDKLYAEITSVMGDEDRWLTKEDINRMPYLDMVFCEAVRLFPIGANIQRTITEDITISSGTLPAGCSLVVPVYHMQRDPRFWINPEAFDPERFTPDQVKLRHPNCYMPFSLGPMDCLGRDIGKKMIKMLCVRVLREFRFSSLDSYKDLKLSNAISATPINGYNVILNRRK